MTAIADASPAIAFARYDECRLLLQLWPRIVIPPAVHREAVLDEPNKPGAMALAAAVAAGTFEVRPVSDRSVLDQLDALGRGEAEAIALAVETPDCVLLIEDAAGRTTASELGVRYIGILGVLALAKELELVPTTRPIVERIRGFGIYYSKAVLQRHFLAVGE